MKRDRSVRSSIHLLLASLTVAGCYGAAPPRPAHVPLPPIADGTSITVDSREKTAMEDVPKKSYTCPEGHVAGSPDCIVTQYTDREEVTRTTTTAAYGDTPIDAAQFAVLTDPDYDKKLARLDELSAQCRRANRPRWVGAGLLIGGVAVWTIGTAYGSTVAADIGVASMAGGTASYAYGYYGGGGQRCNEAEALFHQLDLSTSIGETSIGGAERATEMKTLAEQFNARASLAARSR